MSQAKVAVVTGAARGIGAAISETLLKAGYKVCATDINEERGNELVQNLKVKYGAENVAFHRCDTTKESDYRKTLDFTLKEFKAIDVLINNAGILLEQDPKRTVDVNLMGPVYGCLTGLEYMSKEKGGKGGIIINTASLAGFLPYGPAPLYVATKHAVIGLTRSYGRPLHFDKHGVTFMALCPSFVNTEFLLGFPTNLLIEGLDVTDRPDLLDPVHVSQGVLKLLEDRINGATLVITTEWQKYVGLLKELEDIPIE